MKNNNDITAKYYDIISKFTKHSDITIQEIELIQNFVNHDSQVLEIGAGTGRHAIHLASTVKNLVCIDSSQAMLDEALKKIGDNNIQNVEVLNEDFLLSENPNLYQKFNFIYLMWNTYNEIVLTAEDSIRFFQQCKKYLVPGGKILINIDDTKNIDPENFNFSYEMNNGDEVIGYSWQTHEFEPETNTSISKETIKINDVTFETLIKQRYWKPEQIMQLAQECGLVFMKNESVPGNEELYLVFRA